MTVIVGLSNTAHQRCGNGNKGHFRANFSVLFLFETSCYGVVAENLFPEAGLKMFTNILPKGYLTICYENRINDWDWIAVERVM